MLKLLRVNNIALVASLELELGPGLTLLTGETGAGKSILVDALSLVLGGRASPEIVRSGAAQAVVEALFESAPAAAMLAEQGLPTDGADVIVRREIQGSGRGRAFVNGALVPVGLLKQLAPLLATVHGQHDQQGLLDAGSHVALLDRHAHLDGLSDQMSNIFNEMRASEQALAEARQGARENERRREMLEYQVADIAKAQLRPQEEDELRGEKLLQANASRLVALSSDAYALLYEDEDAALSRLRQVYRKIEDLASIDPRLNSYLEARSSVSAQLDDLALFLRDYRESIQVAPGRLDEIESRLALIDRLKRKYGASVEEVLGFGDRCRAELAALGSPQERERELDERRAGLTQQYLGLAGEVSRQRRAAAGDLESRVQAELEALAMEGTRFQVAFEPAADSSAWTARGLETAEFLLCANAGEELRPLARIASGGELSRILLALQGALRAGDGAGQTLVFDEVDSGIGGRVAEVVGRKLRAIAARHQVLCVTHLAQIAALADRHYLVRKREAEGRTLTEVGLLDRGERVEEIARMLGGETVTDTARRHAREMVGQANR